MRDLIAQLSGQPASHQGSLVVSVDAAPSAEVQLTANCEHGGEKDRGGFRVGSAARAILWRVLFCDRCWEHFRDHQEVIDLRLFEDAVEEYARTASG